MFSASDKVHTWAKRSRTSDMAQSSSSSAASAGADSESASVEGCPLNMDACSLCGGRQLNLFVRWLAQMCFSWAVLICTDKVWLKFLGLLRKYVDALQQWYLFMTSNPYSMKIHGGQRHGPLILHKFSWRIRRLWRYPPWRCGATLHHG